MSAALACFARNGYDATRTRQIAEAAGVSDGALYKHFASKEQLARELYVQGLYVFVDALDVASQGCGTPLDALRAMASRVLTGYRELPDEFVYVLLQAPPFAALELPRDHDLPMDVVTRSVERGQADGSVRKGDSRTLAASFLGCLLEPIVMSRATPGCVPDFLVDDTFDATIVGAAVGAISTR